MEQGEILENISKSISERLKVPIILTYIGVLIIFNWDILFYLFFENSPASERIQVIKENYGAVYFERILICLGIAVVLIIVFAILNTLLNLILKWFYKKDKETTSEIENFEKIDSLTEQLSHSIEEIKALKIKNENLQVINQELRSKSLDIDVGQISKTDYDHLIGYINSRGDREKLLFSLKQLINALKKDINLEHEQLSELATYKDDMKNLMEILVDRKLLSYNKIYSSAKSKYSTEFQLSKSFEDFLKMA